MLKILFKSGKKATETVGKSMSFIDDVLEKEYITSTVDNVKEATGKVVEKAGQGYQTTKDFVEDNLNEKNIKAKLENAREKGKAYTSDLADKMLDKSDSLKNVMREGKHIVETTIETGKHVVEDIVEEGKDFIDRMKGNEEEE